MKNRLYHQLKKATKVHILRRIELVKAYDKIHYVCN